MSSAGRFPRFLTFEPGEREALLEQGLRKHLKLSDGAPLPPHVALEEAPSHARPFGGRRSPLLKAHAFAVRFPDGTEGSCRYERRAPAWHVFRFTYGDGTALPAQHWSRPLASDPASVETKGREIAEVCYRDACERERRDFFARATLPAGGRTVDPAGFRMSPARARELGGRYALCVVTDSGGGIIAVTASYDTLESAITCWRDREDRLRLVVGCCSRLDRRWMLPRFNPLYAEFDPRRPSPPVPYGVPGAEEGGRDEDAGGE